KLEWDQIRAEQTSIISIIVGYVMPLTAFFAVCNFIGSVIVDRATFLSATLGAIVKFIVMTGFISMIGYFISAVGDNFDSDRDELAAQKVAAYSFTPFFLSGVLLIWPSSFSLTVLVVAVGVSAFLIYRGLPPLMKTPQDRALGFAATIFVVGVVVF